jgi:hypothetical protein
MAIQLFGGRPVPKKRVVVPYAPSGLDTGFGAAAEGCGGIQVGSHPEYAQGPQLGNPLKQIAGLFKKKKAVK